VSLNVSGLGDALMRKLFFEACINPKFSKMQCVISDEQNLVNPVHYNVLASLGDSKNTAISHQFLQLSLIRVKYAPSMRRIYDSVNAPHGHLRQKVKP
jgi:hypothetical protein